MVFVSVVFIFVYTIFKDSLSTNSSYQPLSQQEQDRRISANTDILWNTVEDGIHIQTGLKYGPGFATVKSACLSCHSAKLITQNKATREGWFDMIRWMQATQGLPNLGAQEPIILDYLARFYAPTQVSRRVGLDLQEIEWYVLDQ